MNECILLFNGYTPFNKKNPIESKAYYIIKKNFWGKFIESTAIYYDGDFYRYGSEDNNIIGWKNI